MSDLNNQIIYFPWNRIKDIKINYMYLHVQMCQFEHFGKNLHIPLDSNYEPSHHLVVEKTDNTDKLVLKHQFLACLRGLGINLAFYLMIRPNKNVYIRSTLL